MMFITGGWIVWGISACVALFIATVVQHFVINRQIDQLPANSLVIITGCSTGLGFQAALDMVTQHNIHVVATVRKQTDADLLHSTFEKMKQEYQQQQQTK
eukprot:UN08575